MLSFSVLNFSSGLLFELHLSHSMIFMAFVGKNGGHTTTQQSNSNINLYSARIHSMTVISYTEAQPAFFQHCHPYQFHVH